MDTFPTLATPALVTQLATFTHAQYLDIASALEAAMPCMCTADCAPYDSGNAPDSNSGTMADLRRAHNDVGSMLDTLAALLAVQAADYRVFRATEVSR